MNLDANKQVQKVLDQTFDNKPTFSQAKKFKLTEIDQYEVVFQNTDTELIVYETFYWKGERKLLLLHE